LGASLRNVKTGGVRVSSDSSQEPSPEKDVIALEIEIGLRPGFFLELLTEGDDWTFLIKVHALVEAAISHLLAGVLRKPELVKLFAQLELSNDRSGKIAFAKALDCLDNDERTTVRKLSELRNQLVHDVSNVDFDLKRWAIQLDRNQAVQFCKALGPSNESIEMNGRSVSSVEFFKANPRINIWMKFLFLLSMIYQRKDLAQRLSELDKMHVDLAQRVIKDRSTALGLRFRASN
jgi:hypothetical protein